MKNLSLAVLGVVLLVALTACGSSGSSTGAAARLRIGLLPILDVLPIYVAEQEGYFTEQKLDVELTLFPSALERDSAFQAGQIDGELNDLISATLLSKDAERAKVVRVTYRPTPKLAMISVLTAPGTRIQSPADLKGVPVAVSGNTIIEYAADRMLRASGLTQAEIKTMEVTKIPVRVEMLIKGQVQAASLPEPFTALAKQQGARVVLDDQKAGVSQSVMTFQREVVEKNPDAVRRFLAAYEKAVLLVSQKPESFRDLLVDKAKVPDSLRQSLPIPDYPRAGVPTREEVAGVVDWMVAKGMLNDKLSYERIVNGQLLPK